LTAHESAQVVLRPRGDLASADVARLFAAAWPEGTGFSFEAARAHSLCWVSAHVNEALVGFVNVAWDGGVHAFLLDTTVHPEHRRRGIGTALVRCAVDEARGSGARVLHVDHTPAHAAFYRRCGFRASTAGLIDLSEAPAPAAPGRWVSPRVRRFRAEDAEPCRELLGGLSDWFQPEAVEAYLADLPRALSWVAVEAGTERLVGVSSLTRPQPRAFEVHLLAVARAEHGRGVGRLLLGLGERFAISQGARFMQVKTLGGSRVDPFYDRTRGFYGRLGYEALFESERLWGENNPVVVLVKQLG
jgi:ribosomal protein S18 acetylase RimI-like enzyme